MKNDNIIDFNAYRCAEIVWYAEEFLDEDDEYEIIFEAEKDNIIPFKLKEAK